MPEWTDDDWETLIRFIELQCCTPFLGAGACAGVLPLGGELAAEWAGRYGYPFADSSNLVRVAQFAAVLRGSLAVKTLLQQKFRSAPPPNFADRSEIHGMMAELRLPVYITTNYDDFLVRALKERGADARQVVCNWHKRHLRRAVPTELEFEPTPAQPVVYHLHGKIDEAESMVLTEDDYLDFLIHVHDVLPSRIERAFTDTSLLFLGYSLEDMDFKVLFRKLATYQVHTGARHLAVQLKPAGEAPTAEEARLAQRKADYLQRQWENLRIKVFWGSCGDFARELRQRWPPPPSPRPSTCSPAAA